MRNTMRLKLPTRRQGLGLDVSVTLVSQCPWNIPIPLSSHLRIFCFESLVFSCRFHVILSLLLFLEVYQLQSREQIGRYNASKKLGL